MFPLETLEMIPVLSAGVRHQAVEEAQLQEDHKAEVKAEPVGMDFKLLLSFKASKLTQTHTHLTSKN